MLITNDITNEPILIGYSRSERSTKNTYKICIKISKHLTKMSIHVVLVPFISILILRLNSTVHTLTTVHPIMINSKLLYYLRKKHRLSLCMVIGLLPVFIWLNFYLMSFRSLIVENWSSFYINLLGCCCRWFFFFSFVVCNNIEIECVLQDLLFKVRKYRFVPVEFNVADWKSSC